MSPADGTAIPLAPWRAFLREELALQPGRLATMIRMTICCTLTVVLCMVFSIPVPAYAAYIVFLASGLETGTTLMTAIAGAIAITAAVCLTLLIYLLDAGEPALRVPLMAAATFLAMYLSRTMVIGPIAFLTGFVLVITQTLIDDIPHLDALTEFIMWLWVVVLVPASLVAISDVAFGQSPGQLLHRKVLGVFDDLADSLRTGKTEQLARCLTVMGALPELRQRAELVDSGLKSIHAIDMALIEALDELVRVVSLLPPGSSSARAALLVAVQACREALLNKTTPSLLATPITDDIVRGLDSDSRPVVLSAASKLDRLLSGLAQRVGDVRGAPSAKSEAKAFFVPDAFTNPDHVRFALKATLATMLVYIIYSGLDWSGIRTCVVTCFFVALSTVGETVQKLMLRLGGAAAGGLLGLLCIVFVLPHVTTIGGLSLLTACVAFFSAWISTSSERLSYAGMQMAFAFFIGVLQGYGPTEELTVLRDRIIGIVLGNIMMSFVFVTVWPVSAIDQAQAALTKALAALGGLLRKPADGARPLVAQTLHRARRLLSMSEFEGGLFAGHSRRRARMRERLADLDALTAATFVAIDQRGQSASETVWREAVAAWFESPKAAATPVPADDAIVASLAALAPEAPTPLRAALESDLLLSATLRSVTAHAR